MKAVSESPEISEPQSMTDYRSSVEKLRRDAAEAALIRDLATDRGKRAMFDELYEHLSCLADELERTMLTRKVAGPDCIGRIRKERLG